MWPEATALIAQVWGEGVYAERGVPSQGDPEDANTLGLAEILVADLRLEIGMELGCWEERKS